jgi:diguanylate cyclase
MRPDWFDLSSRGKGRIVVLTLLGTLCCILVALGFDSFDFSTGEWTLKDRWINNIYIPIILAPVFFSFLLYKLRELALAHDDLMVLATTDSLTSCLTRRAFVALVDGYLERVKQEPLSTGSLLVIDVDHFKSVNDRYGHAKGDEALKSIAHAIRKNVREIDLVGRMGGEEFGVFMPGVAPSVTQSIAERIRTAVNTVQFLPDGQPCRLSISVGGATFERYASFSDLFRHADERLYEAKHRGRNRVEIARLRGPASLSPVQ